MHLEQLETLADAMASPDPATSKAAKLKLEQLAHQAARPGAPRGERRVAATALYAIAGGNRPRLVRAHALRLIGFIGDRSTERALGKFEGDKEVGEDARMARERIRRGP